MVRDYKLSQVPSAERGRGVGPLRGVRRIATRVLAIAALAGLAVGVLLARG